jgi:hypothetical protein
MVKTNDTASVLIVYPAGGGYIKRFTFKWTGIVNGWELDDVWCHIPESE